MVVEQVTSIICNSILFGTCKIFVWLEGEMYCMLSASLCLNCTAVKRDNKSEERGAARQESPRSGCAVYWWKCTALRRPCKGLGIQERDFSICTENKVSAGVTVLFTPAPFLWSGVLCSRVQPTEHLMHSPL